MHYHHGPGWIVGLTLNRHALKSWALSLHIGRHIRKDGSEMGDACESHVVTTHKEEKPARKEADAMG